MNWNLEGLHVIGKYMGEFPVAGRVTASRVKYGGGVQHTVVLDQPLQMYSSVRDRVLLEHEYVVRIQQNPDATA
jgi:hypothetical protein